MNSYWVCVCVFACGRERVGEKAGLTEKKTEAEVETQRRRWILNQAEMETEALAEEQHMQRNVFSLIALTRSPDLGLFFGRVGKASSFGLVSMAQ